MSEAMVRTSSTKQEQGQAYRLRDRRPETRSLADVNAHWRPWKPDPMISPASDVVRFFADLITCSHCADSISLATLVAAIQRGGWPGYCSPRHRRTAEKRRQRAAAKAR